MTDQQNNPPLFAVYKLRITLPERHIIYNNQIVPLAIYYALNLDYQQQ